MEIPLDLDLMPYVGGIILILGLFSFDQIEHFISSIRKFVIATTWTSPIFAVKFINYENYLANVDAKEVEFTGLITHIDRVDSTLCIHPVNCFDI